MTVAATGHTAPSRVLHLDGLRGIAISLVLVSHFVAPLFPSLPGQPSGYVLRALSLTYTGVDLFFVLSGYLIGGGLLDHRDSPGLYPTFYLRRAARILPLAVLCVVLIFAAWRAGLYTSDEGGAPWSAGVYLLFCVNLFMAATNDWGYRPLSMLWSLALEEQFYLLAPWLVRRIDRQRLVGWLLGGIFTAVIFRLVLVALHREWAFKASLLPFGRLDCVGVGVLIAWLVRSPRGEVWCRSHRAWLGAIALLAVVACAVLTKLRAGNASFAMAVGGYTAVAALYGSVLLYCETHRDARLNHLLAWPPLVLLGRYSYFLYLFQGLVIGLTVSLLFHGKIMVTTPTSWLQLAAGLSALFFLAAASHRWLEAPFLRLGRSWSHY